MAWRVHCCALQTVLLVPVPPVLTVCASLPEMSDVCVHVCACVYEAYDFLVGVNSVLSVIPVPQPDC